MSNGNYFAYSYRSVAPTKPLANVTDVSVANVDDGVVVVVQWNFHNSGEREA